jgi:hypothetical protein
VFNRDCDVGGLNRIRIELPDIPTRRMRSLFVIVSEFDVLVLSFG